ncbi:MAG: regulatory protein GemA [Pseudomonadota bacterium]
MPGTYVKRQKKRGRQDNRRAMLAKVHIAKKETGMRDEDYRAFLARHCGGKTSAAKLTQSEMSDVLAAFRDEQGWKQKPFQPAKTSQGRLALALWKELYKDGLVRSSRPTQFLRKMTGRDHPDFCNPEQLNDVIEAMKAMRRRGDYPSEAGA